MKILENPIKVKFLLKFKLYIHKNISGQNTTNVIVPTDYNFSFVKDINLILNTKNLTIIPENTELINYTMTNNQFDNVKEIGHDIMFSASDMYIDSDTNDIVFVNKYKVRILPYIIKDYVVAEEYGNIVEDTVRKMNIDDILKLYNRTMYKGINFVKI